MLRSPQKFNEIDGSYIMEQTLPHGFNKIIYSVIEVDGFPLTEFPKYALDVQELIRSGENSGTFKILMEGNTFRNDIHPEPIVVTHQGDYISWQVERPMLERIFHFEQRKYTDFIHRMKTDLQSIIGTYHKELWSNASIDNDQYRKWEFVKPLIEIYKLW